MNLKKLILTVFVGINIVSLWCHSPEAVETLSLNVPQNLIPKQSFDCALATDFATKTQYVKQGYILLGSVHNPNYKPSRKRSMDLLENQKYGFIFYKVPSSLQASPEKHEIAIDIPYNELVKAVKSGRIQVSI